MVTEPTSMEDLVYFTNRTISDGKGKIKAWVYRNDCPKCGKAKMSKPKDEKTGKPKIRAKEYVCPECGNTVEKEEYEPTLSCEIKFTCPHCGKEGETETQYKRKTFEGVPAVVFECTECGKKIGISKKMKAPKKKKG
ncbi:hypothetical protein ACFL0W_06760 [Nanoarchaeota archaeon]